jgi:hypothetical protein
MYSFDVYQKCANIHRFYFISRIFTNLLKRLYEGGGHNFHFPFIPQLLLIITVLPALNY